AIRSPGMRPAPSFRPALLMSQSYVTLMEQSDHRLGRDRLLDAVDWGLVNGEDLRAAGARDCGNGETDAGHRDVEVVFIGPRRIAGLVDDQQLRVRAGDKLPKQLAIAVDRPRVAGVIDETGGTARLRGEVRIGDDCAVNAVPDLDRMDDAN